MSLAGTSTKQNDNHASSNANKFNLIDKKSTYDILYDDVKTLKEDVQKIKLDAKNIASEERKHFNKEKQMLQDEIKSLKRNAKIGPRRGIDVIECYDIETVRQCPDWPSAVASIVLMVTLWAVELTLCITSSILFPPLSIFLLACTEAFRGRQHSIFQLLPWNNDAIRAELYFSRRDFTDWSTFAASTLKTIIAASVLSFFGYIPGILFAFQLWSNFYLVRAKIWWRQFLVSRVRQS